MASISPATNYTQGYSKATISSHVSRTAQSDAGFLLPHLRPTSHVLDIGCGPATITVGLAALVANVTAVELTDEILAQARETIASTKTTNITLVVADLLAGLPFPDDSFDVVFSSQLFPHLPTAEMKAKALEEMRRVLKPGGISATRDAAELHFYPGRYGLDRLWAGNMARVLGSKRGAEEERFPGGEMPALYRRAGFEGGKVEVGAGTTVHAGEVARRWFAEGCLGRLREGDEYRESWVRAGIAEGEIEKTRLALRAWAEDEDAWYVALQAEVLAWK
ncbi:S-adenosyl-L-methionine-dependent methyltransferase [Podospora aff. communis PSN243]|uniref:S-adenosyl-L-methionine-dependent methyltransferase n=1 Tax=Podospora aff. communis PSN243 TaxID=3040156 RepID=A0AAV9G805_9PEZI|nr:S-adenosyl-L-methionine-dependent methyltransferase [Podospora aff. communis PSN243]